MWTFYVNNLGNIFLQNEMDEDTSCCSCSYSTALHSIIKLRSRHEFAQISTRMPVDFLSNPTKFGDDISQSSQYFWIYPVHSHCGVTTHCGSGQKLVKLVFVVYFKERAF